MPKEGFFSVTLSIEVYDQIKKKMDEANKNAGFRKYRSISHFVEECIMSFKPPKV